MGWYEEHQNDNANPNNTDEKENNEERTVDSKGYINADDPSHDTEKYENVYDKPFEGTARETLNVPVNAAEKPSDEAAFSKDDNSDDKKEDIKDEKTNGSANGGNGKSPYYEIKVKTKKNNKFGKAIAICLVCSLGIGTGLGAGYGFARAVSGNKGNTYDGVLTTTAAAVSSIKSSSASDAIASVYSAVVSITTESEGMANYGFYTVPYKAQGAGSGVIFSEDNSLVYVATNEHVIDGAQNIAIAFDDADEIIPATVVGYDETTDLAVLSVEKSRFGSTGY